MEHGKFKEAVAKSIELFSEYIGAQKIRLAMLPKAKAETLPMSIGVTQHEILNATSIFERLEMLSLKYDSDLTEHSVEEEANLVEWLSELEDAFKIQYFNVSTMAEVASNPAHDAGGRAVASIKAKLDEVKAIEGLELSPARQTWHTQRNRDGALYVETLCSSIKARVASARSGSEHISEDSKNEIQDILRRRRDFKDSALDMTVETALANRALRVEQDSLYPNPEEEGGRFTPVFDLVGEKLREEISADDIIDSLRMLQIPKLRSIEAKEDELETEPESEHERTVDEKEGGRVSPKPKA